MEVDVALLAEHKLDTTQPKVLGRLYEEARNIFCLGSFTINVAATDIETPTPYKPGGVLSLVNRGIKRRVLTTDHDPLGRWVPLPSVATVVPR